MQVSLVKYDKTANHCPGFKCLLYCPFRAVSSILPVDDYVLERREHHFHDALKDNIINEETN